MTNTLSLNNVTKIYRRGLPNQITVLDQVNLEVKKGEVVGLIAPSGAGKSTLLHISGLLDNSDNGQVIINGIDYNILFLGSFYNIYKCFLSWVLVSAFFREQ